MRTKRMPSDMAQIEDRRGTQRSNDKAKWHRAGMQTPTRGYKEDPESVKRRILIGNGVDSRLGGKGDRENGIPRSRGIDKQVEDIINDIRKKRK